MIKNLILKVATYALLLLLGVLILSLAIWLIKPKKELNIFILNKTVPTMHRYDHKALSWVINHEKYTKSNNTLYNLYEDYHGFYPIDLKEKKFEFKSLSIDDIDPLSDTTDIVYYADTYGVYYNDWYAHNLKVDPKQKVYGGLNHNDYLLLKRMKEKNKTIITEFILLDTPTSELVRNKTEALFGMKWEGWVGRYFPSLDTTAKFRVPVWITNLYQEQNNDEWPFKNAGVVLIHKYGKILVLEQDTHLESAMPIIYTDNKKAKKYRIPEAIEYPYWFDIVSTGPINDTLSHFSLNTNEKGDSLLTENRISATFPAIIKHNSNYTFYYFAGDFADNTVNLWSSYFSGVQNISPLLYTNEKIDRRKFFWKFYNPLMEKILQETYRSNH